LTAEPGPRRGPGPLVRALGRAVNLLVAGLRLASGSATRIHDHSSWGAFCCVVGSVLEERYERADDGSLPDYARLKKLWRLEWRREDGISTVLPYERGIHRVGNPTEEPAISVHLYGPRLGEVDGRDYDPSQNYVCDRTEDQ
jgi:predicted metal-dependent enzyme (double-stranded beta helix superfamily)